jgi:ABC-type antimicrobial peptide transport system permease subunit
MTKYNEDFTTISAEAFVVGMLVVCYNILRRVIEYVNVPSFANRLQTGVEEIVYPYFP